MHNNQYQLSGSLILVARKRCQRQRIIRLSKISLKKVPHTYSLALTYFIYCSRWHEMTWNIKTLPWNMNFVKFETSQLVSQAEFFGFLFFWFSNLSNQKRKSKTEGQWSNFSTLRSGHNIQQRYVAIFRLRKGASLRRWLIIKEHVLSFVFNFWFS